MSTNGSAELADLLRALRTGAVDPHRLAAAAAAWPDDGRPGFLAFLTGRGGQAPRPADGATATFPGAPTPSFDGNATPTHDPDHTPDFLPRGHPDPDDGPPLAGRYRILRTHRDGGLGRVHVALDTAVGREVALKTIRPDRRCGALDRARFVREARVTGRLEHPCVVPLYDLIDPADDRPYYAMRFVTGRTLAEATTQYHKARAAGTATRLDLVALLDAFVAVCRAVAFAHSRGYLHRDLKGQNVVLGDFGEVFLLDWGLATPIADTADEPPGGITGTPAFMAPEVAAGGPAGVPSDIYGLGAVLYVLLTGQAPYDGPTPTEVLEKVKAAPPPPPRAVTPDAPPGLDAVCRTAMARDPAGRYPTADALATDVRRWLADEPVAAFRDPFTVRAVRWARRHRTAVAAAAVFLLTTVVGLTASTVLVTREKRATEEQRDRATELAAREAAERDRAEREKARAEEEQALAEHERAQADHERGRAEDNYRTARDLAFTVSRRVYETETGRAPGRLADPAREKLLAEAGSSIDRLLAIDPDDFSLLTQAAAVHRYAANAHRSRNETRDAAREYRAAVALWEKLAARRPGDPHPEDNLGQTRRDYALLLKRTGKLKAAAAEVSTARDIAGRLEGRVPDSYYHRALGLAELERSGIAYLFGEFAAAEASARAAIDLFGRLKGLPPAEATPADPWLPGMAYNALALALRESPLHAAKAAAAHDRAVALLRPAAPAAATRDARLIHLDARLHRAETLSRLADRPAGLADDLTDLIVGFDRLRAAFPDDVFVIEGLGDAFRVRGEVLLAAGRAEAAHKDLREAERVLLELQRRHPDIPEYLRLLGLTYAALSRSAAATNRPPATVKAYAANAALAFENARKRDPDNVHHRRAAAALKELPGGP